MAQGCGDSATGIPQSGQGHAFQEQPGVTQAQLSDIERGKHMQGIDIGLYGVDGVDIDTAHPCLFHPPHIVYRICALFHMPLCRTCARCLLCQLCTRTFQHMTIAWERYISRMFLFLVALCAHKLKVLHVCCTLHTFASTPRSFRRGGKLSLNGMTELGGIATWLRNMQSRWLVP